MKRPLQNRLRLWSPGFVEAARLLGGQLLVHVSKFLMLDLLADFRALAENANPKVGATV
jgi:hypothetical protein